MGFLEESQLKRLGFRFLGTNVKISERASIHNPESVSIGDNSRIDDYCVVSGNVTIGRNVHLAVFCNIAGGKAGVTLEDFSGLAYGCHVFSQSDDYSGESMTNPTIPARFKSERKAPVVIRRHSIVGTASVIFPGVTLGEGTAVGAMSLVVADTDEWSVYAGITAKKIKIRSRALLKLEDAYLATERRETVAVAALVSS